MDERTPFFNPIYQFCNSRAIRILITVLLVIFFVITVILFSYFATKKSSTAISVCDIDFGNTQDFPLPLYPGSTQFFYPETSTALLKLKNDESLEFNCPGNSIFINDINLKSSTVTAKCGSNSKLTVDKTVVDGIKCGGEVEVTVKKSDKKCGNGVGEEGLIGFNLGNERFATVITVCFDLATESVLYSYYDLTKAIRKPTGDRNTNWVQDKEFYDKISDVNSFYLRKNQTVNINKLLNLPSDSTKYFKNDKTHYISRGHLTANADFLYALQRSATFRYINAAPQWYTLNGGNWNQIEIAVRNYAADKSKNLQVWTGVFGISTLLNSKTTPQKIYLYSNDKLLIPVPEQFWKIVYDPQSKLGVVFISFNSPYMTNDECEQKKLCNDISGKISWLNLDQFNLDKGWSYACRLGEFQSAVNVINDKLQDNGILM